MACSFQDPASASAGTRHHPLHGRAFANDRFFYDQSIDFEIGVVLGVRHRALQCLVYQGSGFLRAKRDKIERCRNRQTLNLTRDFPYLER